MPIRYTLHAAASFAHLTAEGPINYKELSAAIRKLLEEPDFKPGIQIIGDFRTAELEVGSTELWNLLYLLQAFPERVERTRWALLAQAPATFGLLRMLSSYGERLHVKIGVFRTLESAREWLNERDGLPAGHSDRALPPGT
ncbi:MAG: hypothetical protein HS116_13225 [Planctomycetes bacterium]|nr:hypothetical protein [Planctomycetota bacterium]